MTQLIIELIRFIITLIEKSCDGDKEALKRLCEIAPDNMKTELVAKVQDELDRRKFGKQADYL